MEFLKIPLWLEGSDIPQNLQSCGREIRLRRKSFQPSLYGKRTQIACFFSEKSPPQKTPRFFFIFQGGGEH